ncbi:MAG TPA: molybdopterin-dependent oxidoreductase [Chloroflexota bacterium]
MTETPGAPRRIDWAVALLGGALATVAALWLMFWLRATFQIRTLPERALEYSLLYVPPEQFEAAVSRFGTQAKVYALYAAVAVLALVLLGLGARVLRARSPLATVAVGAALWVFAMVIVMPLTGGGLFATELPQDALLVNACYLAIALSWLTVLLAVRALALRPGRAAANRQPAWRRSRAPAAAYESSRRAFLAGAAGLAASLAAVFALRNRVGGSDLPLATVEVAAAPPAAPSPAATDPAAGPAGAAVAATPPGALTPTPATAAALRPSGSPTPSADTAPATPTDGPTPAAVAAAPEPASPGSQEKPAAAPPSGSLSPAPAKPAEEAIPQPPPPRQIKREHDGASTAVPRKNGELAAPFTPNDEFYITTKNPVSDPIVDGATWRLVLDGEVNKPVQLDYRTLRRLPAVEFARTLECISNFTDKPELAPFGNNLISNAAWKGVRLKDVLGLAGGLKPGARFITLITADEFNAVIPAEAVDDPECILAYEMNGQVLPREHGYPARLLMPGRYGLKSAKWVIAIRPQQRETLDWYGQRGWSKDGVAKTMSRIDLPGAGEVLPAGPQRIAGIAYAGNRGISKVEFSADGGKSWQAAEIFQRPEPGGETWVFWQGNFAMPEKGGLTLRSRATDGAGDLQIETFSLPQPNGASGWHTVEVRTG